MEPRKRGRKQAAKTREEWGLVPNPLARFRPVVFAAPRDTKPHATTDRRLRRLDEIRKIILCSCHVVDLQLTCDQVFFPFCLVNNFREKRETKNRTVGSERPNKGTGHNKFVWREPTLSRRHQPSHEHYRQNFNLLALKFEFTQKYSTSKSQQLLDKQEKRSLSLIIIFYCWIEGWLCSWKTPSFEVEKEEEEEGGGRWCRQRPPSILWFGGSCSSIVVLSTFRRGEKTAPKNSAWSQVKQSTLHVLFWDL